MMNCMNTRRTLLGNPAGEHPELIEHLNSCPGCRTFAKKLTKEEALLRTAMNVPVPDQLQERILLQTALRRRPDSIVTRLRQLLTSLTFPTRAGLAVAFSSLMAVGIWHYQPIRDPHLNWSKVVLAHVIGEPEAVASNRSLPRASLVEALGRYGLAVKGDLGTIRFVERCVVPGGRGLHVVIDTDRLGKVSLILPPTGLRADRSSARSDGYTASMVDIDGVSMGIVTNEPERLHELTALLARSLVRQG